MLEENKIQINVNLQQTIPLQEPEVTLNVVFDDRWEEINTNANINCENGLALSLSKTKLRILVRERYQIDEETSKKLNFKYYVVEIPSGQSSAANPIIQIDLAGMGHLETYREMPEKLTFHRSQSWDYNVAQTTHRIKIKVQRMLKEDSDSDNESLGSMLDGLKEEYDEDGGSDVELPTPVDQNNQNREFSTKVKISSLAEAEAEAEARSSQDNDNSDEEKNGFTTETSQISGSLGQKLLKRITNLEKHMEQQTQMIHNLTQMMMKEKLSPKGMIHRDQFQTSQNTMNSDIKRAQSVFTGQAAQKKKKSGVAHQNSSLTEESNRPDIIFAYANVLGEVNKQTNQFRPKPPEQIIDPDSMFQEIEEAARTQIKGKQKGKALKIQKRVLNFVSFDRILEEGPRVLFIMCHGGIQRKSGIAQFLFEDADKPYLADLYEEDRLIEALQKRKNYQIDVIVLSTCHSEQLGKILLKSIRPAPAIIAINSLEAVQQWATMQFNPKFIKSLINNKNVKTAFADAQRLLNTARKEDTKICCCQHSHDEECLFKKMEKKLGSREAVHDLFCQPRCNCYQSLKEQFGNTIHWDKMKDKHAISHFQNCPEYKQVYSIMSKGVKNYTELQLSKENFMKAPQKPDFTLKEWDKINYWCCCASDLAHRESDKFIIVNNKKGAGKKSHAAQDLNQSATLESAEAILDRKVFEEVPEGEIVVDKPDLENVAVALRDKNPNFCSRIEQVKLILDFFIGGRKKENLDRLMVVHGPPGSKIDTIAKAIWYAKEHEQEIKSVSDGAYLIDLSQAERMQDILKMIIREFSITSGEYDRNSVLKSPFLQKARCVIVFEYIKEETDLLQEFICFLIEMSQHTHYLKIILLIQHQSNLPDHVEENFEVIEVGNLTRDQAADHLLTLIRTEGKIALIKDEARNKEELKSHKIFDIWEKRSFGKQFARDILRKLGDGKDLQEIANELEAKKEENKSQINEQSFDLQNHMISLKDKGHILLNDILSFMALCPGGLCLTELKIILLQMLRSLNSEESEEKMIGDMRPYTQIIREISQNNFIAIQGEPWLDEEEREQLAYLKSELMQLLRFEALQQFDDEVKIKMAKESIQVMINNLKQRLCKEIGASHFSKEQLFAFQVSFYAQYATYLLFRLNDSQNSQSFDCLTLQSADLHYDMESFWSMWKEWLPKNQVNEPGQKQTKGSNSYVNQFNEIFSKYKVTQYPHRFEENRANLVYLLQESTIQELWPELREQALRNDFETEENKMIWTNLQILSQIVPSLLAKQGEYKQASNLINQARSMLGLSPCTAETQAILSLMQVSFRLHQQMQAERDQKSQMSFQAFCTEFNALKDQVNQNFAALPSTEKKTEGEAEILFLQGVFQKLRRSHQARSRANSSLIIEPGSSLIRTGPLLAQENLTDKEYLNKAYKIFRKLKKLSFGELKTKFELLRINMMPNQQEDNTALTVDDYFQRKKDFLMKDIKEIEGKCSTCSRKFKIPCLLKSKKNVINTIRIYCNKFKAQVCFYLCDYTGALNEIKRAFEKLEGRGSINLFQDNNESAKVRKSETQLPPPGLFKSLSVFSSSTETTYNTNLVQSLNQLKTEVLHKLHSRKSSLFTFMKAQPIVYRDKNEQRELTTYPESDSYSSKFPFVSTIMKRLKNSKRNMQVKFDILTKKSLNEAIQNGTKLLHITSDMVFFDHTRLCFEDKFGERKNLKMRQYGDMLGHQQVQQSVDVVGIGIPQSFAIGQVFRQRGVKHVLCFKSREREESKQEKYDLIQPRLNFIFLFCTEFYGSLADGKTVRQAFGKAKDDLKDKTDLIWEYQQALASDDALNMEPVLLGENDACHDQTLDFGKDTLQVHPEQEASQITDTSKMRSQLVGMTKDNSRYIGRKIHLHMAIRWLSRRDGPPLVVVAGKGRVGKKRFIQEICYYFHMHNQFLQQIFFEDLSKIDTEAKYQALIDKLSNTIKSFQVEEQDIETSQGNSSRSLIKVQDKKAIEKEDKDNNILWAFTNYDQLEKKFWKKLEPFLFERCSIRKKNDLRILMSRNTDRRAQKLRFKNFYEEENKSTDTGGPLQTPRSQSKDKSSNLMVRTISLNPLNENEGFELLLANCNRRLTAEDFISSDSKTMSKFDKIKVEDAFIQAKGMPCALLSLARKLTDSQNLLYLLELHEQVPEETKKFKKSTWSVDLRPADEPSPYRSKNSRIEPIDNTTTPTTNEDMPRNNSLPQSILKNSNKHSLLRQKSSSNSLSEQKQGQSNEGQKKGKLRQNKQLKQLREIQQEQDDQSVDSENRRSRLNSDAMQQQDIHINVKFLDESPMKHVQNPQIFTEQPNYDKKQWKYIKKDIEKAQEEHLRERQRQIDEVRKMLDRMEQEQLKEAMRQSMQANLTEEEQTEEARKRSMADTDRANEYTAAANNDNEEGKEPVFNHRDESEWPLRLQASKEVSFSMPNSEVQLPAQITKIDSDQSSQNSLQRIFSQIVEPSNVQQTSLTGHYYQHKDKEKVDNQLRNLEQQSSFTAKMGVEEEEDKEESKTESHQQHQTMADIQNSKQQHQQLKEQRRREKELLKEQRRRENEQLKEQRRRENEQFKEQRRKRKAQE